MLSFLTSLVSISSLSLTVHLFAAAVVDFGVDFGVDLTVCLECHDAEEKVCYKSMLQRRREMRSPNTLSRLFSVRKQNRKTRKVLPLWMKFFKAFRSILSILKPGMRVEKRHRLDRDS